MFSLAKLPVRTYEFEHPETGAVLHVKAPKLETLQVFNTVFSDPNATPDSLAGIMATILKDNQEETTVTKKQVMHWMDSDQLAAFVGDFLGWLNGVKSADPN